MPSVGQVAYEGYVKDTDGVSLVSGDSLPQWDNLPDRIKRAWEASAKGVIDYAINEIERKA